MASLPIVSRPLSLVALSLLLLSGCAVGTDQPATPGSPSAQAVAELAELRVLAGELEAMAIELEEEATAARALTDQSQRMDAAIALRARTQALADKNAVFQDRMAALEASLRDAAGDPAPPQEED